MQHSTLEQTIFCLRNYIFRFISASTTNPTSWSITVEHTRKLLELFQSINTDFSTLINLLHALKLYRNSLSYRLTSAAIYPFISLATVSTGNQYLHSFRIKVSQKSKKLAW